MRICCLQHAGFEQPGSIAAWAERHDHALSTTHLYQNGALPELAAFDFLLVMGGPMSVHDDKLYPWLLQEKRFLGRSIEAGKSVLGICLGSQLVAEALGGEVRKNREKEIGWFSVDAAGDFGGWNGRGGLPRSMEVFQWHGETFELPRGALHLWRSDACEHQGFAFGERVIGLQFHLEVRRENVADLIAHCGSDLTAGRWIQSRDSLLSTPERFKKANALMDNILDNLAGKLQDTIK